MIRLFLAMGLVCPSSMMFPVPLPASLVVGLVPLGVVSYSVSASVFYQSSLPLIPSMGILVPADSAFVLFVVILLPVSCLMPQIYLLVVAFHHRL